MPDLTASSDRSPAEFPYALLRRSPDLGDGILDASDATDRLLLERAHEWLATATPGEVVVIGDRYGALALGAAFLHDLSGIRVHQDPLLGERALAQNAARLGLEGRTESLPLGEDLLRGAKTVLLQLPRALEALEEIAQEIARWADPDVRVIAGGRIKHMSLSMNDVLGRSFARVDVQHAKQKSRTLRASDPRPVGASPYPRQAQDPDLPFALFAHGAAFNGTDLDHGTRLLLKFLPQAAPEASRIVDLGTGTGALAVSLALSRPSASVIATDQSFAAIASASATVAAAGVADRVALHRADALEAVSAGSADLIVLNPPFHNGATVDPGIAQRLISECARALAPGGELWVVYNTPLGYGPMIEREIGPSRKIASNKTFTVTQAIRR